jgi:hypothetical protein
MVKAVLSIKENGLSDKERNGRREVPNAREEESFRKFRREYLFMFFLYP